MYTSDQHHQSFQLGRRPVFAAANIQLAGPHPCCIHACLNSARSNSWVSLPQACKHQVNWPVSKHEDGQFSVWSWPAATFLEVLQRKCGSCQFDASKLCCSSFCCPSPSWVFLCSYFALSRQAEFLFQCSNQIIAKGKSTRGSCWSLEEEDHFNTDQNHL